MGLKTWKKSR